jgi:Ca-activated chloride channel family protein
MVVIQYGKYAKNASADFKFSSAVAWFGLKLRDSNWFSNKIRKILKPWQMLDVMTKRRIYRAEFIRLVEDYSVKSLPISSSFKLQLKNIVGFFFY